ncbi:Bug family tripartite tricarboxylate transporter substrate binding protein [Marinivivus vitaminiproducens]|uniref:Bug family tripartite tricarboxylate transporter substrate binding protein n=1 Tax=Marinivivus vitaminiproducens TaxID=3035935 RepID=UPI0027A59D77|nr:tripartite tricarboxylate transporter substrate binding protein [Geminicoccaceae bacterium SCSIO 64248]
MKTITSTAIALVTAGAALAPQAHAQWAPSGPIEFIVTSGAGGGTDNFARMVQSIIAKHDLVEQPIIVSNKGGGSGAEGYVYAKAMGDDPHKLTFGTNNEYLLPHVARLGYKASDLNPVATLALDEFLIWVNAESPYQDAQSFIEAAKAAPGTLKFSGSQSKDTDQILVSMIQDATGAKFIYIPFQGGSAAGTQLAGGHVDGNTNNPNENVGQWRAGMIRPLCVFSDARLPEGPKVAGDMGWSDIPTCAEAGIPVDQYKMPRTVWTSPGVPEEATAYYADLMQKVYDTPEWKEYLANTSQTGTFLAGDDFRSFIESDEARVMKILEAEGWAVN